MKLDWSRSSGSIIFAIVEKRLKELVFWLHDGSGLFSTGCFLGSSAMVVLLKFSSLMKDGVGSELDYSLKLFHFCETR